MDGRVEVLPIYFGADFPNSGWACVSYTRASYINEVLIPRLFDWCRRAVGNLSEVGKYAMADCQQQLTLMHSQVIGAQPSADQEALYRVFPDLRGYSDVSLNTDRFDAVVLVALHLAAKNEGVLVFAPTAHEKWVVSQFNDLADRIFSRCKAIGGDKAKRTQLAKAYETMFGRISLTGRLLQIPKEPSHWLSFGFEASGPLPEWMPDKLWSSPE